MSATSQIPLRNIWLLFLYAADLIQIRDRFDSDIEAARDLPELLGRLLTNVVEHRLRRNLSRGYRVREATLSRVKGRINLLVTETRQLMDRGQIACTFEEHTIDTPRNRLVRAALDRLASRIEDQDVAHRCRKASGDFGRLGVSALRPSRAAMATDQIGRNESDDRFMIALAGMVFDAVIPSRAAGRVVGALPLEQEHLVRRLFERAVGNALRIELGGRGWTVKQGRRMQWPCDDLTEGMAAILPGMQTDIELNHAEQGRRIIIDTKFTRIFTKSDYREAVLKSGYLYQMYAYLRTQERADDRASLCSEGMLLHPQVGAVVDEAMVVQGHTMRAKTIDLTALPDEFEAQLRTVISPPAGPKTVASHDHSRSVRAASQPRGADLDVAAPLQPPDASV